MDASAISKRMAGKAEFFLRKNGPALLTAAGLAGFAGTTYLVGKAVLRAQDPIKGLGLTMEEIKSKEITAEYTKKQQVEEAGRIWILESFKIARIFAPAAGVGVVSVACIVTAHGMMKNRQAALAAAYVALDNGFKAYRRRIVDEVGPERERELYRGFRTVPDTDEAGNVTESPDYSDVLPSQYSRFFDEMSPSWTKTPEYNMLFLRGQQTIANDRLQSHGFLFLNEVYEALGLPRSQAGQIVGWKLKGNGDGYVDFGLNDISDESSRAFTNGLENVVLLDFNVDGPITIS